MLSDLIITSLVIIGTVLSGVVKNQVSVCSSSEFPCRDGTCVSVQRVCDGVGDCADNSDETACVPGANSALLSGDVHNRRKRQSGCQKTQFKCRDGSCVPFYAKCDGVVDCPDGSDETHPLCRNSMCQYNLFRCTYGACVDGTAPCNGIQECADNSDELLPRCQNETRIHMGRFTCTNGQKVSVTGLCDGELDCVDGSDETLETCAGNECVSYLFRCAYGACVDSGSDCNGRQECADGSDESDELCNRTTTTVRPPIPLFTTPPLPTPPPITATTLSAGSCPLPPYPENGRYTIKTKPFERPGQPFTGVIYVNVTCDPGYAVDGMSPLFVSCYPELDGANVLPRCKRYCALPSHHSVDYECKTRKGGAILLEPCDNKVFVGTTVIPKCRDNYRGSPSYMHCTQDGWNFIARCAPDCGRTTPQGQEYIIGGKRATVGEIPWHAAIYAKTFKPFMQICGGSIVTTKAIISAAHCFWKDGTGRQAPDQYSIVVGKIYRPYSDDHDLGAQFSDVTEIHMPDPFRGSETNFQNDIAIVMLQTAIVYKPYIRPVCVSYDPQLNSRQLVAGALGKISGWGLTDTGKASPFLKVVEMPFVTYNQCYDEAPIDFREYITGDKICAGFKNGTALCQGDSGGGLAFPDYELGVQRYYLRGIVSTAPRSDGRICDPFQRTTFTELIKHESWIKGLLYIES